MALQIGYAALNRNSNLDAITGAKLIIEIRNDDASDENLDRTIVNTIRDEIDSGALAQVSCICFCTS